MGITLKRELIQQMVNTLKAIKPRGYESMDRIVGLVMLLESIIKQADEMAKKQAEEAEKNADD